MEKMCSDCTKKEKIVYMDFKFRIPEGSNAETYPTDGKDVYQCPECKTIEVR